VCPLHFRHGGGWGVGCACCVVLEGERRRELEERECARHGRSRLGGGRGLSAASAGVMCEGWAEGGREGGE
jgi:hypothetical protein